MSRPDVAVVFPDLHRRGGIERICWDLLGYLATDHDAVFVGSNVPEGTPAGVGFVPVLGRRDPGPAGLAARLRRTATVLEELDPQVTVSMGAVVPAGDVVWVQSVHRAWLEAARTIQAGPVQLPAQVRFLMPRHRALLALEARYFRSHRPSRMICTSEREVADLDHLYGVDPAITTVIPNPFDPELFNLARRERDRDRARAELNVQADEFALLLVANELHRKGLAQLVEAMALADDSRMSLHVVGKTGIGSFQSLIDRHGLAGRVQYHGPSNDVGFALAAADMMVLPTQYEPFGLVIVEALAAGVPVLTTRLAGASGAVDHGRTGLLLEDPYDIEELSHLLQEAGRADLAAWGREAASSVDEYRRDRVMARVESIIFS